MLFDFAICSSSAATRIHKGNPEVFSRQSFRTIFRRNVVFPLPASP